ncbi:MAG TPA: DUF2079 domain-containing protein, partial [Planctomycetaceae bacterium]
SGVAEKVVSGPLRAAVIGRLGGSAAGPAGAAEVPFGSLFAVLAVAGLAAWPLGAAAVARRGRRSYSDALATWGRTGWLWWLVPGAWEIAHTAAAIAGLPDLRDLILAGANFLLALAFAGWAATFLALCRLPALAEPWPRRRRLPAALWLAAAVYAAVFVAMNWQLWRGLYIPHGDSAMFEEHLWNLTHGKGFRSFIDGHVFLGEHFQVIHLALLPLHLLWPSHLLLELCQSIALAAGAIPVFRMATRHTASRAAGSLLACAYLLYFPMQMLDIDTVGKTFRLEAFGVTLLLFGLDALDRGRLGRTAAFLLLALTSREDFAIVFAPLGLWVAAEAWLAGRRAHCDSSSPIQPPVFARRGTAVAFGIGLAALSVAYVLFVVKIGIPWFRGGEPHYVSYFGRLGGSLDEMQRNLAADPALLPRELATAKTALYAVAVLLPVGFLPLLSPGRLAVGLPVYVTLCLNELSKGPYHHFHAPLVPVLFWAAAAGLGRVPGAAGRVGLASPATDGTALRWAAHFAWTAAFASGFFIALSPLALPFWDPGSPFHWRKAYVPGRRAELFPKVLAKIPPDSRVAVTDYLHPRFTHHDRSYDYGRYPRAANDGRPGAPPDSDYIVIDAKNPSDLGIHRPEQVPEYRDRPDRWDVLPDDTDGYFLVLKRRWEPGEREEARRRQ